MWKLFEKGWAEALQITDNPLLLRASKKKSLEMLKFYKTIKKD